MPLYSWELLNIVPPQAIEDIDGTVVTVASCSRWAVAIRLKLRLREGQNIVTTGHPPNSHTVRTTARQSLFTGGATPSVCTYTMERHRTATMHFQGWPPLAESNMFILQGKAGSRGRTARAQVQTWQELMGKDANARPMKNPEVNRAQQLHALPRVASVQGTTKFSVNPNVTCNRIIIVLRQQILIHPKTIQKITVELNWTTYKLRANKNIIPQSLHVAWIPRVNVVLEPRI